MSEPVLRVSGLEKRYSNNWQGLASYSYLDATGNTVSDGNADFAGDVFWLDPRSPNIEGTVPGTIHHLFKAAGSYMTRWGVELGSPNSMVKNGWRSSSLKPGDKVTVVVNPLKSGEPGGIFVSVVLADGRKLGGRATD